MDSMNKSVSLPHPMQAGIIALYVLCAAVVGRSLLNAYINIPTLFPQYLSAALVFLLLFVLVMWRNMLPKLILHLYFIFQSIIVTYLLFLPPHLDFINVLFILLSYQVALIITGRGLWIWCGIYIALTVGILIHFRGLLPGIAFSTTPIAGCIIFPVYVIANRAQEMARAQSLKILDELQEKHQQLELQASQLEQAVAIEERNRLARELHDSVSQTMFSIILNARAAQILQERDPNRLRPQLIQLQSLAQDALLEMRSLIVQLRPQRE